MHPDIFRENTILQKRYYFAIASTDAATLLSSLVNEGQQEMADEPQLLRAQGRSMRGVFISFLAIGSFLGCAAAKPLSITLYNPKTNVSRTCKARTTSVVRTDINMLSQAVEACARQLEAHGFVRTDGPAETETKPAQQAPP
jgi:hypothetical protein